MSTPWSNMRPRALTSISSLIYKSVDIFLRLARYCRIHCYSRSGFENFQIKCCIRKILFRRPLTLASIEFSTTAGLQRTLTISFLSAKRRRKWRHVFCTVRVNNYLPVLRVKPCTSAGQLVKQVNLQDFIVKQNTTDKLLNNGVHSKTTEIADMTTQLYTIHCTSSCMTWKPRKYKIN